MSYFGFMCWRVPRFTFEVCLQDIQDHPHPNQHSFQCLYQGNGFVRRVSKIDSSPSTVDVELCVVFFAKWKKMPRNVIMSSKVVLFYIFRASAKTMLGAIQAFDMLAL